MVVVMDAETFANNVLVSAICVFFTCFFCGFCFCRCGFYAPDIFGVIFDLNVITVPTFFSVKRFISVLRGKNLAYKDFPQLKHRVYLLKHLILNHGC